MVKLPKDWTEQNTAVICIDLQKDFTQAFHGPLATLDSDGTYIRDVAAELATLAAAGLLLTASQDWHPRDHSSFASNHSAKKPFTQMILPHSGVQQTLWPDHCVENSPGADFAMAKPPVWEVFRKGCDPLHDSYSVFKDDGGRETGLRTYLEQKNCNNLIVFGLATDYCVKASIMDAIHEGFRTLLVTDLCRPVDPEGGRKAVELMRNAGCLIY